MWLPKHRTTVECKKIKESKKKSDSKIYLQKRKSLTRSSCRTYFSLKDQYGDTMEEGDDIDSV